MSSDCIASCERRASGPDREVTEISKDYFWAAYGACLSCRARGKFCRAFTAD
jgi:hypothetical protein